MKGRVSETMQNHSTALRDARREKRWTQAQVAERIGVASITYSRWERGSQKPYPSYHKKLSEVFGKSPEELGISPLPRSRITNPLASPAILADETIALIGRAGDIKDVCAKLRHPRTHLLTLIGPPGIGKTVLAKKVASELHNDFKGNCCFVSLTNITNSEHVLLAVAHKLGIADIKDKTPFERLKTYLQDRQMLLVLDNFEHVKTAGKALADLLAVCHSVKALLTSLSPLDVPGERRHIVPRLVPPFAASLFNHHVKIAGYNFTLSKKDERIIVRICEFVNGNPALIILAAGGIPAYSPRDILKYLEEMPENVLAESLPAMFTRLYALLTSEEQRLFRRLLIFTGSFTETEVEEICTLSSDDPPINVYYCIKGLSEKHFIMRIPSAEGDITRFKILEAYHLYAYKRLKDEEFRIVEQQHYAYFLTLAEKSYRMLRGPQSQAWRNRLEDDLGNLQSALDWCLEKNKIEQGLRLTGALLWFWYLNGHWKEGLDRTRLFIERADSSFSLDVHAQALFTGGFLAFYVSEYELAKHLLEKSLVIFNERHDIENLAYAQTMYAMARGVKAIEDEMLMYSFLEEGVSMMHSLNDEWGKWGEGWCRIFLGYVVITTRQDPQKGLSIFKESQRLFEEVGEKHGTAWSYLNQADAAWFAEDYGKAEDYYEQAHTKLEAVDDPLGIAWSLGSLGNILLRKGTTYHKLAASRYAESLERSWKLGDKFGLHNCFMGTTELLRQAGLLEEATCLLGATNTLYQKQTRHSLLRPLIIPQPQNAYETIKAALGTKLDKEIFAKTRWKGECMPEDEAVLYARTQLNKLLRRK